eukprot:scaffold5868_cov79-Skeletonema_dohrnii-CCMP3373.AAC.1
MFADLAKKIARPLPAVDGDKKKKFKSGTIALGRSLNASTPSSKKRLQNEKKNTKKSASLPWNDSQERTEEYSVDAFQRHLRIIDRLKELLHYNGRSKDFDCNGTHVALMNNIVDKIGSAATNNIKTFEREMCRLFNENYGQQDVFLWNEMCPRKEMRKEQLLLAIIDVFEKVGLLDKQGMKSFKIGPNATCRTIFQVGDVLTDVKVHALEEGILQRKTQFGNEAEVKAIHDAYSQTKKTFGHLHENIHRLQAIYKVYYGRFIQPIQVMLSLKKVGKDPTKGSWSAHEQLCLKIHAALSMLRVDKFLAQRSTTEGGDASTDPSKIFLMMAEEYDAYCMKLETAKNEVARSFALFSKYTERWKQCRRAVRLGNSVTLESEGNEWLALWSAVGKKNYCISTIRRMELLYETLSPDTLEYFRANIMLKMSDGDSYMAMDDFVEKQNLSTKNLPPEQDFAKCCKMTRHLQVIYACGQEIFGQGRKSRTWFPSWTTDVMKIYELLNAAKVFDDMDNDKIKITDGVLWDHVTIESKDKGSAKMLSRENVALNTYEQEVHDIFVDIRSKKTESTSPSCDDDGSETSQQSSATAQTHVTNCSKSSLNELLVCDDDDDDDEEEKDSTTGVVKIDTLAEQMRVLKRLNNMKKEVLNSKWCKMDLFVAGNRKLKDIKVERDETRKKQKRRLDLIDLSVASFQRNLNSQAKKLDDVMSEESQRSRAADHWEESIAQDCEEFNEIEYLNSD